MSFGYIRPVWRATLFLVLGQVTRGQDEFSACLHASKFVLVEDVTNFDGALQGCRDRGGDLAVPLSAAEHNFVVSLVPNNGVTSGINGIYLGN